MSCYEMCSAPQRRGQRKFMQGMKPLEERWHVQTLLVEKINQEEVMKD